ncbi:EAL domain-containing protein [Marinobacter sp.]|uniref:EAL domain-containing protein n=1 Tax=Marinobacter sp. TaxID=50741 RepID=UPI003A90DE9A
MTSSSNSEADQAKPSSGADEDAPSVSRAQRLALVYRALNEINQAIIRTRYEDALLPLVCQIANDVCGIQFSWIGIADLKDHAPLATAQFPVKRGGQPFGVLSAFHVDDGFFDREVTALLNELALNITFAFDSFDRESERRNALEALRSSEQHFRAYFERSMFGMAASSPAKGWIEVNQALCNMLGYTAKELMATTWADVIHPDDIEFSRARYMQLVEGKVDELSVEKRFIHKSGYFLDTHLAVRAVRHADGRFDYAVALIEDVSFRKMAARREQMRRQTLEKVARGGSLKEIMSQVIESVESIYSNSMCSILLMDDEGKHLFSGAAPSLPGFFTEAINGVSIGVGVGSCGTSAFTGKRTVVEDIASHPYWENFKGLAAEAGLGSCWSEPIHAASGNVLGTFAIYRKEPCAPDTQEIALIESAANLVGIAIERAHAQEELHLASSIYRNSSEAVMVTDTHNRIVAINPAFTKVTGYTLEETRGKDPSILHSGHHNAEFFQAIWQEVAQQGFWQGEVWNRRKNGEAFPSWLTINVIRNKNGDIQRHVVIGSDITGKVRSDELIWRQANYDFLTNLPNRYMFQDRLEQEIRKSLRQDSLLALLFIDLDHFKDVNDTLGHPVGDQLLVEAAVRINSCVRDSDTVARMSGDEFTVILPRLENTLDGEKVAEQIIRVLAKPYTINNETIYVQASAGITFCPNDAAEAFQLISNADQAMYAAKTSGRNRLAYFTQSLHDEAQNRLKLLHDMRSAVENRQFELHFQPIIDLANGNVCKAEALIRWNHPERGMISPAEFIPLAEESGLIVKIGDWVFREAAAQAKRWCELYDIGLQISVNVSPVQFQSDALSIADWLHHLSEIGLDAKHLSIEITEGLLLNASDGVKEKLLRFRDAGIQVAIDDFGVGYSALSYLKRFDIDYLKIDQSFIQNLETDQNDLVLSEAIVMMAHRLGLHVIAEGVETQAQQHLLLEIGCDHGQGYFFSRPLPAAAFEEFLAKPVA